MARRTSGVSVKLAALVMRGLNLQIGYFVAHMAGTTKNPNMTRRLGPGILIGIMVPLLKPWLWRLRKHSASDPHTITVLQDYLVGDLFMALPAIKVLSAEISVKVICRPDCLEILRAEGLEGIPFTNAFFLRPGILSFLTNLRATWKLRGTLGMLALDFDADPRTAFWLKLAGVETVVSFNRSSAHFFDAFLPLPISMLHQADKDLALARALLNSSPCLVQKSVPPRNPRLLEPLIPTIESQAASPWLISCWTRRDAKNWPFEKWDDFLERMLTRRVPFVVLDAPDGDAAFQDFRKRWSGRVKFLNASLYRISLAVRASAGVVGTDNFLGHMAGYYGKPVLWLNGSSDPAHVMPRGPKTICVQFDPMPCRPCGHRCENVNYKACLTGLSVDAVWNSFELLQSDR